MLTSLGRSRCRCVIYGDILVALSHRFRASVRIRLCCDTPTCLRTGQRQDWAAGCYTYAFYDVGREAGVLHPYFWKTPTIAVAWHHVADHFANSRSKNMLASLCRGISAVHQRFLGCVAIFNAIPSRS